MLASSAIAAPLAKPLSLAVSATAEARFVWQAVDGAAAYRVAVFDAADADGKRPLLAAVWVKGLHYDYGKSPVVAVGKLPNTKPLPLPAGRTLRVMVAAARADGSDKSEWTGEDFKLSADAAPAPTPAPTVEPTAVPQALSASAADEDAEIELEGGDEFKSSPEPAVLDVEEGAATGSAAAAAALGAAAGGAVAAGSAVDGSTSAAAKAVPTEEGKPVATPSVSADEAAALLKAGDVEKAEEAYRALLHGDGANAELWEGLGNALAARRMKAEAFEAYSQALLLDGKRTHLKEWIRKNVPRR